MLLGLDFGSSVGVALGGIDAHPVCTTWQLPKGGGASVGPFAEALLARLEAVIGGGVTHVCFEAPYVPLINGRPIPNQTRRAYGSAAICEALAHRYGATCIEIAPTSLKKFFTGDGRADKAAMMHAARRRGFEIHSEHEADGAACWLHMLAQVAPRRLAVFDMMTARK